MNHKYHIFQLDKNNINAYHKMFEPWDMLHKYDGGFDIKDYKNVWDGEIDSDERDEVILDILFEEFNLNHPNNFHGHSLSVSDIVVLDGTMYFCDSIGWKRKGRH